MTSELLDRVLAVVDGKLDELRQMETWGCPGASQHRASLIEVTEDVRARIRAIATTSTENG